jgi:hypothetical protein
MTRARDPSGWRNFPKPRPLPAPPKRPTPAIFYGVPAELIAQWCSVSMSTAYAYKSGRTKPGKQARALFKLHQERRVLTAEWDGWLVKPDGIVDPEGNETNRNLLRGYAQILAWAHDLAQRSGDEREIKTYWELLRAA